MLFQSIVSRAIAVSLKVRFYTTATPLATTTDVVTIHQKAKTTASLKNRLAPSYYHFIGNNKGKNCFLVSVASGVFASRKVGCTPGHGQLLAGRWRKLAYRQLPDNNRPNGTTCQTFCEGFSLFLFIPLPQKLYGKLHEIRKATLIPLGVRIIC